MFPILSLHFLLERSLATIQLPEKATQHLDEILSAVTRLDPGGVLAHGRAHFGKVMGAEGPPFRPEL